MNPVPDARTHTRTILDEKSLRGGGREYLSYPNRVGKSREDDNRGALRVGVVEENDATESEGIAGFLAAVTHEENGEVRFYIWQTDMWIGPHWALSEEIVPME